MPRQCQCCQSEYRLQISSEIKAGEPHSAIAERYGVSPDSVGRHVKHVRQGAAIDPHALLSKIIAETGEIAAAASLQGDSRAALEAHTRSLSALQQLLDLEAKQRDAERKPAQTETLTLGYFDSLIETVTKQTYPNLDFQKTCPLCGQFGAPRGFGENPETHG